MITVDADENEFDPAIYDAQVFVSEHGHDVADVLDPRPGEQCWTVPYRRLQLEAVRLG